jgi:hypothetical protein
MMGLAIQLLWMLIYAVVLCGVVYLVLYGINHFISPIPARVEQAVWFVILLLVIIAVLTVLAGGSVTAIKPFRG